MYYMLSTSVDLSLTNFTYKSARHIDKKIFFGDMSPTQKNMLVYVFVG